MDINRRKKVNKFQCKDSRRTTNGESEFKLLEKVMELE